VRRDLVVDHATSVRVRCDAVPDDLFDISGKVAVVTGGSSGIGAMIARGYVEAGVRTYISSRKVDKCQEVADELNALEGAAECIPLPNDLSTEAGCRTLAEQVAEREELLHILVNNAGATWGAPLAEHDEAAWNRVLDVNVQGVFHTTKFVLPLLQAAGTLDDPARVLNVGSIEGNILPQLETYSYSSSKAAVHHLSRHLAAKLSPTITVNAIAPGPFESKMMKATLEAFGEVVAATNPLKRIGRPDDMVGISRFLASKAASYITGAVIPVDGGLRRYAF
jgi:NAD(P)-dependent dehydrogenase (short-subunit alcohol dehydrogenase family)